MSRVVEREVLESIRLLGTKNWILLGDSRQYFLGFFVMPKTEMPLVNVTKDLRMEGTELRTNSEERGFLAGRVVTSREGWFGSFRRVVRPVTLTGSHLTHPDSPHAESSNVLSLGFPHSVMV